MVDVAHVFSASYASFLLAPLPAMTVARLNKRVVLHYHSGEADDHLANWGARAPLVEARHHIVVPSEYLREVLREVRASHARRAETSSICRTSSSAGAVRSDRGCCRRAISNRIIESTSASKRLRG
jgi:hypothetical protein